jgi:hypothetical protein
MLIAAAVTAMALAVAGPLAANAAPSAGITLSVSEASPNGSFTVTAADFQPNEHLTLSFDSKDIADANADATGAATLYGYVAPGTALGVQQVTVTGDVTGAVSTDLTIVAQPTISLSASTVTLSQLNGTGLTATVKGFQPGETIQFGYGTGNSGSNFGDLVKADADGAATIAVTAEALFGRSATEAQTLYISAGNEEYNVVTGSATLQIVADPASPAPAAPAVPVKGTASFTG